MGRSLRMDYAFYGSVAEWPMASTIASVAGVVLMFGQQVGLAGWAVVGQAEEALRRLMAGVARPWVACVGLLAAPLVVPRSGWILSLRGEARIDSELSRARADGYYEELIRSSPGRGPARPADRPPGRKSFTESGLMVEVADYRRRVLRPGLDARWNGAGFRTNRLGYRGPEVSRGKPPGTFRVIVLGSSNTMGHGVEAEASYPRLLEAWLAGRVAPGRRVEVVNLAVSGDSPTQQWLRLRVDGPGLEPDWILSDITAMGPSLEEQHLRWAIGERVGIPFDFVREALAGSGVGAGDSPEEFHKKLSPYLKPMLDRTFRGWAEEASRIGAPLTVVILPRADSKTPSPRLFQLYRDLSDRHGLRRADLTDAFDRLDLDDYRIAPWDHHPNALGHRLIFARLRDNLLADDEFEGRLGRAPARPGSAPGR